MQVATGRGTRGSHPGNDFAYTDRLPLGHCNALQVVVRGDKAVAVIDFHAIAAAPGVPTHGPDHAGVGCVDQRAASRGEILAPVELARQSGERIDPQPEGRARKQHFERRVEFPGRRPVEGTRRDIESANAVLIEGLDRRAFKRHRGFVTCLDRGRRRAWGTVSSALEVAPSVGSIPGSTWPVAKDPSLAAPPKPGPWKPKARITTTARKHAERTRPNFLVSTRSTTWPDS